LLLLQVLVVMMVKIAFADDEFRLML